MNTERNSEKTSEKNLEKNTEKGHHKMSTEMSPGSSPGMKTWTAKTDEVARKWWIVDATGARVGRLATHVATLLRGKHKAEYTPHIDTGDFVVVINTDKLELSGSKWIDKKYYRHSRYFGSMKAKTAAQMKIDDSTFVFQEAVRGMLPTNKLSRHLILKMKTFKGGEHTHGAQKPVPFNIQPKKK
jgi:large subunit ribosomal protein L13